MRASFLAWLVWAATAQAEHPLERMLLDDPQRAIEQGLETLSQPLAAPERTGWLMQVGRAAIQLGDDSTLTEVLLRLEDGSDPFAPGVADMLRAENLRARDRREEALAHALRGAERLVEAAPALRLQGELMLCAVYVSNQRFAEAEPRCAAAAQAAREAEDEYGLARVENVQSFIPYYQGQVAAAIPISERALQRARRLGADGLAALIAANLSQGYLDVGRVDEALALAESSLRKEEQSGRRGHAADDRVNYARALHAKGRTAEALEQLARGIEEALVVDDRRVLQELYESQGRIAEADGQLALALDAARKRSELRDRPDARPSTGALAELEARYRAREQSLRIRALEQEQRAAELRLRETQVGARRQRELAWVLGAGVVFTVGLALVLGWALRTQRRLAGQLQQLAECDPLTGIENRRVFMQRVQRLLDAPPRPDRAALMILDLDHFKSINDQYGHPFGDTVLLATVAAVREALAAEPGCRFARLGGEEFGLLCERHDATAAAALAERLRAAVAAMRLAGPRGEVALSVSIGLAPLRPGIDQPSAWFRAADAALYRAKGEGRNRVAMAEPAPA